MAAPPLAASGFFASSAARAAVAASYKSASIVEKVFMKGSFCGSGAGS